MLRAEGYCFSNTVPPQTKQLAAPHAPCAALAQGYGTFESPDGARYVGNWASNLKHGIGKKTYANGDSYEGLWNLGKAEGPGRCSAGGRSGRDVPRCAAPFGEGGAMNLHLCWCVCLLLSCP